MSSREHLMELIRRLPESEVVAAERYLEFLCADPVSRALALAPEDDVLESALERQAVALAREEFARGERGTSLERVKADSASTTAWPSAKCTSATAKSCSAPKAR